MPGGFFILLGWTSLRLAHDYQNAQEGKRSPSGRRATSHTMEHRCRVVRWHRLQLVCAQWNGGYAICRELGFEIY